MMPIMGKSSPDRRQSRRVPLLHHVIYAVSLDQISHNQYPTPMAGQIQNVSEGGICMVTDGALKHTQVVEVALPLPVEQVTTRTIVEVCWVRRELKQGNYTAGLRFLL
jgi:c-di-GMP-binding flagellar brake protein YcgR